MLWASPEHAVVNTLAVRHDASFGHPPGSASTVACVRTLQVSLTSLEEVFLAVVRGAELAHAQASGRDAVTVHLDGGRVLQARAAGLLLHPSGFSPACLPQLCSVMPRARHLAPLRWLPLRRRLACA